MLSEKWAMPSTGILITNTYLKHFFLETVHFSHELDQLGAAEAIEREIQEKKEAEEAEALLHSESFVEYLGSDHLFRSLFQDDVEGNALMLIGEEMEEYYDEYQEQFSATCKQLFEYGQVQYKIRKSEVDQFTQSVEGAKLTSQQESIVSIMII